MQKFVMNADPTSSWYNLLSFLSVGGCGSIKINFIFYRLQISMERTKMNIDGFTL